MMTNKIEKAVWQTRDVSGIIESSESLGKTIMHGELSQKYFQVIKELSHETRKELLEKDFFNKLFNQNETL
jgi:hypothetical protein